MTDTIYLDHAAATPMRPEVQEAMNRYVASGFGNPSSVHRWGREARAALEGARERLADLLGADRREIVFTGGGTEADNLAVLGRWRASGRTVVCSAIEHKAVLGAARAAAAEGAAVSLLGVDAAGRVDPESLEEALSQEPAVVSVMWGNNEVGTVQPMAALADRCREAGTIFHSDAVQAFGRLPIRVDRTPLDLAAFSAHKIGGPRGVGALYVRSGVELAPLVHGGGQESGMRPGTQDVAGAVGFAVAAELAEAERASENARLAALRDRLEAGLLGAVADVKVNGGGARLPHILNVTIPGVDQELLMAALDVEGLAAASGSACQSGAVEASHVLVAMGAVDRAGRSASVRLSLGRTSGDEDVQRALELLPRIVQRLRMEEEEAVPS